MKKLLALLLALAMMAACTLAIAAETPAATEEPAATKAPSPVKEDTAPAPAPDPAPAAPSKKGGSAAYVPAAPVDEKKAEVTTNQEGVTVVILDAAEIKIEGVDSETAVAFELEGTKDKAEVAVNVPGLTAGKKIFIAVKGADGEVTYVELDAKFFEVNGETLTVKLDEIAKEFELPETLKLVIG